MFTFAKIMADEQRKIDGYKSLKVYQKAVCVFDITAYFVAHFMDRGHDRTVDQMQQAARSGKQNIVEGYSDAEGSTDSEHKLTVIAKGSLEELKEDFQDYLRMNGLETWGQDNAKYQACVPLFKKHNDSAYYMRQIEGRSDEEIANIALIVIYQALAMLQGYIAYINKKFLTEGGVKEQRFRKRLEYRESRDGRFSREGRDSRSIRSGRFGRDDDPNQPNQPNTPNSPTTPNNPKN